MHWEIILLNMRLETIKQEAEIMKLEYNCPECGTPLGYEGLCWKCSCEQERRTALNWTPEEVALKQKNLAVNISRLTEMEEPEFTDFWLLLCYRDAITPEIQRAALSAGVFYPSELYYHAPEDVRDALIAKLMKTEDSRTASELMACLAFQGDDEAMQALLELERNPRPWRSSLYAGPSSYAECGGWTFDLEGRRKQLNFDRCIPMLKGNAGYDSSVVIGRKRSDACPHCGGPLFDMLVLDGRSERLRFLGLDGILTASCCPSCVGLLKGPAFNRFSLDGGSEILPSELFNGEDKIDCYIRREDYQALEENRLVLGANSVPLFYGAAREDAAVIGGFANWVQDAEYAACPCCGKPMKYLAQIPWSSVFDCAEGILYIEFCPDCRVAGMIHQQT